jgi:hypothetical protein
MKLKNPPLWLWDMIGIGFLILGVLGVHKYGISQENLFYVGCIILGFGFLLLALLRFKTKGEIKWRKKRK